MGEHDTAGDTASHTPSAFAAPIERKGNRPTAAAKPSVGTKGASARSQLPPLDVESFADADATVGMEMDTAVGTALPTPLHCAAASPEILLAASAPGAGKPSSAAGKPVEIIEASAQSASTLSVQPSAPADAPFGYEIVEAKFSCHHPATFLSFDSNGNLALSCASQDSDAGIEIRTFQNGKIISEPSFCVESPFGFTFQSSGHLVVADPWSHCVRLFDYKDGRQTGRFKCKDEMDGSKKFKPLSVAIDAAGDRLAGRLCRDRPDARREPAHIVRPRHGHRWVPR